MPFKKQKITTIIVHYAQVLECTLEKPYKFCTYKMIVFQYFQLKWRYDHLKIK